LLNELPFIAFYWLLASTLLAFGQGDIDSPGGWAAFGLAVLTTVGLLVVVWRGLQAGPAVDHALSEGLGPGWRAAIDASMAARLRRHLPRARILFGPFPVGRHDVERVANISYGDAGKRTLLDVYRHRSHPLDGPVLVYLPQQRQQEPRDTSPPLSPGEPGLGLHQRDLPAETGREVPDHHIDAKKVIAWATRTRPPVRRGTISCYVRNDPQCA
jgi:hypothetical protein